MTANYQCLRGMRDIPPHQALRMQHIQYTFGEIAKQFGCLPVQFPILESVSLFQKSIGIETDIIGQEMYGFEDKNGELIALRPEGTAGCLRSMLANGLIQRQKAKVFYSGPMFRRERPQQGRFRQFDHFGVEMYGYPSGGIDVELILISAKVWERLKIPNLTLHLNYLGSPESRTSYRDKLKQYWEQYHDQLSPEEQQRAQNNPLRLLDSKNPEISDLISEAPRIKDSLASSELETYQTILSQLDQHGISYIESNRLVRGLDYYSDFIFEWICSDLGAQSTVCGGGRYDPLVKQMGHDVPATGFAAGIDRIESILPELPETQTQIYLAGEDLSGILQLAQVIYPHRHQSAAINIDYQAGKLKNKLKISSNHHSHTAYIYGDGNIKVIGHKTDESISYTIDSFMTWYGHLSQENNNAS